MWPKWIRSVFAPDNRRPRRNPKRQTLSAGRARRPRLDQLEERAVPATFVVNTLADTVDNNPGDGLAQDAAGNTSLRAAVMEANALAGADRIELSAGTYQLTIAESGNTPAASGDLDVTGDLTIVGSATGVTEISAAGLNDRIFDLPIGTSVTQRRVVSLDRLQLTDGVAAGSGPSSTLEDRGGALRIDFFNTVNITNSAFLRNKAPRTGPNLLFGLGGAIDNNGFLTILDSRFDGNQASNGGGAIYAGGTPAEVVIRRSTFTTNTSRSGGAIENHEPMTIENSLFSGNSGGTIGSGQGGAIDNNGGGNLTLTNCTVTGNVATFGGGISNADTLRIFSSTIAGNTASFGGGVTTSSSPAKVTAENSIIATNTADVEGPDFDGTVQSLGHNLIGNTSGSTGFSTTLADVLNVNPQLGALANNGGPTQTRALLAGSPAIDAGNTGTSPATDQRGVARPQGTAADIGAFEFQPGPNNPPVATGQSLTTNEDTPLNGTLTATDPDGNPLTFAVVAAPAHGTVAVNTSTGAFTYTPTLNYNGADSFTFKANDGQVDSNVAIVSITVNAVNDPPVAVNDAYSTNEDTILTVPAPGVLGNDFDVEGSALTAVLVTGPANGTLTLNANGSFSYRPRLDFNGTDTFTYKARDGSLDGNTATVTITVNPVNDAPRPTPITTRVTINEDTSTGGTLTARDPENDPFTFSMPPEFAPPHGTATVNADGTWTYTPAANFYGTDTFGYKVTDNHGAEGIGVVEVTVKPVNDAPTATGDAYSVDEEGSLVVTASPVTRLRMVSEPGDFIGQGLTYDFNPTTATFAGQKNFDNGASLSVDPPPLGEFWFLDFAAPNEALLTPGTYLNAMRFPFQDPGKPGLDVSGNGRGSNTLTGQFTVYDVAFNGNALTRFAAAFEQHSEGAPPALVGWIMFNSTFGSGGGVLANDTDVEADLLLGATLVTGPAHGTLDWHRDGTFTYTPNANFVGIDTFTYRTNDGRADSNVATVTITVNGVNDAPVANDGSASTNEDTTLSGNVTATDVDGDTLTYSVVSGPAHGALALNASGSFTYTPAANYNGPDSFTFKANDGTVDSNVATFAITVNAVNDAPVANDASFSTDEDAALSGTVTATDVDGDPLTYSLVAGPAHGTVVVNASGSFTYTPAANYNGGDSFTFRANDGSLNSNTATVSLTVNPVNDAPVAANGSASTNEDTTLNANVSATDVDGDPLTFGLVTGPAHGTLVLNANGAFTYTPVANYNGADSFTFKANDGTVDSNTATFAITVNPVNDAPVALDDSATTNEDTGVTIGVLANDTDVDGEPLVPVVASGPAHGALVVNADGTITYTPAANFNGTDSFTYRASDGSLDSNAATVVINVSAVNDAPVAANDSYSTGHNLVLNVPAAGVLANDTDVDGNALSAVLVSGPANGTLTLNPNGSFTYTPSAGFTGTDTFTYKASDGTADSNVATVAIQVAAAPVTEGKVTGGGFVDGGRRRFNINVQSKARKTGGFALTGALRFVDRDNRIRLQSTSIQSLSIDASGTRAVITGTAKVNGRAGYTFTVMVSDLGEPGRGADKFRIQISGPGGFLYDSLDYASALGVLEGGNIQVRKKP